MADEDFVVDDLLDPLSNGMEAWCTDEMFPLDTLLGISAASHRPLRVFFPTDRDPSSVVTDWSIGSAVGLIEDVAPVVDKRHLCQCVLLQLALRQDAYKFAVQRYIGVFRGQVLLG